MATQYTEIDMATERRNNRTPFKAGAPGELGTPIYANDGQPIGLIKSLEMAEFVVRACNRYDSLMAAFDLCRGDLNGRTQPLRNASHKALKDICDELMLDIERNGR